jgi:hypothetical protein
VQQAQFPNWVEQNGKSVKLHNRRLVRFLSQNGFGNYQVSPDRTSEQVIFRNNDGVLELHSPKTVKNWIERSIDDDSQLSEDQKDLILDRLIAVTPSTMQTLLYSLPRFSETGLDDTTTLPIFRDGRSDCYVHFCNATVRITADDISLVQRADEDSGNIWESKLIDHEITLCSPQAATTSSQFQDFIHYAMKSKTDPKKDGTDLHLEIGDKRWQNGLDAFETGFGYLLHEYNPPDEAKVVAFIDIDSSPERTDGGNGKSVAMECVRYFRKTAFIDGKSFRKAMNDSARFNFSNVEVDTGFIFINDLNPDFDLTQLFSIITDDMTVEQKGKNKVVIPKNRKPKLGLTTNYVITGVGVSYERRQHIVEFGNFWSKCSRHGIKPRDVIGKNIGDEFDKSDWNHFYNYGFHCVQRYLKEGLIARGNSQYKIKALTQSIEGTGSSGEVVSWIDNWIRTTRAENGYNSTGITVDDFHAAFATDYPDLANKWSASKLHDAVFQYVSASDAYEYNAERAHKGNTKSSRRIRIGARGEQKDMIKITDM